MTIDVIYIYIDFSFIIIDNMIIITLISQIFLVLHETVLR